MINKMLFDSSFPEFILDGGSRDNPKDNTRNGYYEPYGESLASEDLFIYADAEQESISEGEVRRPFDPTQIRVETKTQTIDNLIERMRHGEILLRPDFQRAEVWKDSARSRLIESILIRIPLPAFYVDATNEDLWQVIDGQQRLSTIRRFVVDQDLRLQNLEFLTEFEGKNFDELPQNLKRRIRETNITVYKIEQGTPEEVKFNIFRRINTGGLPLSAQEIRHALNLGRATEMLKELAETDDFLRATDGGVATDRMGDRECVLRFLAFTITDPAAYNEPEFDAFLSARMKDLNSMDEASLDRLAKLFHLAMLRATDLFGKNAFRKIKGIDARRQPINKAVMEAWAVALAKLPEEQFTLLQTKNDLLLSGWIKANNESSFFNAVSQGTGDPVKVKLRFGLVQDLIRKVLDA